MNGFTAHQPPKVGLVFLNLAIGFYLFFGACYLVLVILY